MPAAEEQKYGRAGLCHSSFSLNYFVKSGTHKGRERRFQNEDGNIRLVTKPASQCTLITCKLSPRNKNFKIKNIYIFTNI